MNTLQEMNTLGSIVAGTPVEAGRFGFQAAILYNGFRLHGGSLIAPNVVLTATVAELGFPTGVALGCVDVNDFSSCEVIEVVETFVSAELDIDSFSIPTTLLILREDSVQKPVAIAASGFDLQDGQDLTVIGRGTADPATLEDSGGILLETKVEALSQESCDNHYRDIFALFTNSNDYYSSDDSGPEGVNNSDIEPFPETIVGDALFCAAGNENGPCGFGDFGGPTFLRCDATGYDVQVGYFVPFLGCANDGLPGVFSSVFQEDVFEFIQKTVQSQGHELKTVETSADFCVIGGTQPTEEFSDPPTPFPTFDLKGWTCLGNLFGDGQNCHCNCGIPDPDCQFKNAVNCEADEICVNAVCVNPEEITRSPTVTPTTSTSPTSSPSSSPTEDFEQKSPSLTPTTSPTNLPTPDLLTNSPTLSPTISPSNSPTEDVGQESPTAEDNGIGVFLSVEFSIMVAVLALTLVLLIVICHFYRKSHEAHKKENVKALVNAKDLLARPLTADAL